MEEVVVVHTGSVPATVGEVEGDVHEGGIIFIPEDTWVTIKNTSAGPTSIVFIFSHPGFDDYMRCTSFARRKEHLPQQGRTKGLCPPGTRHV